MTIELCSDIFLLVLVVYRIDSLGGRVVRIVYGINDMGLVLGKSVGDRPVMKKDKIKK